VAKKVTKKASSSKAQTKSSKSKSKTKTKVKTKVKTKTRKVNLSKKVSKKKTPAKKTLKKAVKKKVLKKKTLTKKAVKKRVPKKKTATKKTPKKKVHRLISTGAGAKLAGKVGSSRAIPKTISAKKARAKSSPLRVEELDEFRVSLLKYRRDLLGNVSRMRAEALEKNRQEAAGNLSKFPTSPADLGSDNYELEFTLGLMESERELLKKIDDALRRIDQGLYGICEATGQAISRDRLRFEPWARHTVEHASLLEKGLVSPDQANKDESEK
jgi:RNA polymerase-binding protein DksA